MTKIENRQWTWMDRTDWVDGIVPDGEPDKEQWQDEETGLPCLIHRGPMGAWCGYVGVRPDHPWHGIQSDDCSLPTAKPRGAQPGDDEFTLNDGTKRKCSDWMVQHRRNKLVCEDEYGLCGHRPDAIVSVHGGLTYSDRCRPHTDNPEHGICHVTEDNDEVWWFGFDCSHLRDQAPKRNGVGMGDWDSRYRSARYVKSECEKLAKQLIGVANAEAARAENGG